MKLEIQVRQRISDALYLTHFSVSCTATTDTLRKEVIYLYRKERRHWSRTWRLGPLRHYPSSEVFPLFAPVVYHIYFFQRLGIALFVPANFSVFRHTAREPRSFCLLMWITNYSLVSLVRRILLAADQGEIPYQWNNNDLIRTLPSSCSWGPHTYFLFLLAATS